MDKLEIGGLFRRRTQQGSEIVLLIEVTDKLVYFTPVSDDRAYYLLLKTLCIVPYNKRIIYAYWMKKGSWLKTDLLPYTPRAERYDESS